MVLCNTYSKNIYKLKKNIHWFSEVQMKHPLILYTKSFILLWEKSEKWCWNMYVYGLVGSGYKKQHNLSISPPTPSTEENTPPVAHQAMRLYSLEKLAQRDWI